MTLARSRPGVGPDRSRGDLSAPWRHVDPVLLICALAVAGLGVLMVYSATRNGVGINRSAGANDHSFLVKQFGFVVIGVVVMGVTASIDYRKYRDWIVPIYTAMCLMLALVVSPLGSTTKGAQSRFELAGFQLQPSELAKPVLILALASLFAAWKGDIDIRRLGLALGVALIPMALIMKQPDLGTALVFIAITIAIFVAAGVRGRYLAVLALVGVVSVVGILQSNVLATYQKERLTTFLDSNHDTAGATYNVAQSQTTIANGGAWGKGLFEGPQTQLGFVPEQQTDFIFTVVGEELGFAGAATLLVLFAMIMWRTWRAAQLARDLLGTLICVGVLAMFGFQVFESVGMTMGIMPVTGIPLPFMSYGGSSAIACFAAVGLVLNVHMHRFR
jgi:rod shape determining protein RodA